MKYIHEFDPAVCGGHERRYALSAQWLEGLLTPGSVVYDCGRGQCPLAHHAPAPLSRRDAQRPGEQDLRYELAIPSATADGMICSEVIEHMKDRGEDNCATFTYSGIRNLLAECFRILKPGGLAVPEHAQPGVAGVPLEPLQGDAAWWFKPHVRELGPEEVRWFLAKAGFQIARLEGVDVWPVAECPAELAALARRLGPGRPAGKVACSCWRRSPNEPDPSLLVSAERQGRVAPHLPLRPALHALQPPQLFATSDAGHDAGRRRRVLQAGPAPWTGGRGSCSSAASPRCTRGFSTSWGWHRGFIPAASSCGATVTATGPARSWRRLPSWVPPSSSGTRASRGGASCSRPTTCFWPRPTSARTRGPCQCHASQVCGCSVDAGGYTLCAQAGAMDGILQLGHPHPSAGRPV